MRRFAPQLFAQLSCIALVLLSVSNSPAQIPKRPSSQEQIQNREWALANLRRDVNVDQSARAKLLTQLALKNDFRKLQIVNNELMARMFGRSVAPQITPKEIRSSLDEIKRIAERLRSNFGLPKVKADEPANNLALKPGLLELDKAVVSFIENPLFEQPGIFDTELATRAAKDLSDVLKLAEVLRKLASDQRTSSVPTTRSP